MPIELITGPAGAGKAPAVLDAVRAHLAHGREPLLVVPAEADQALYRRELAETGAALGVKVERFEGLLAEVLARAGAGEAALGPLARETALAAIASRVLAREQDVAGGFARALAALVGELQEARIAPERLAEAVERWGERPPFASSLVEVFAAYRELLRRSRRSDRELRLFRALDALRRTPALWGATPVLLLGFHSFTALELDAIETLGAIVDTQVTVSLAYEPGRVALAGSAETFERLRPLAREHTALPARADRYARRSREALHHLERSLFEQAPTRVAPGGAVQLLEGESPRAELELLAGEVKALLDRGTRPDEVAIVHRTPRAIAGLAAEVLDGFAIPHSIGSAASVAQTAIGAALGGLLRCCGPEGTLGDLLAWLRAPGVLDRPQLADRLEAKALRGGLRSAAAARELWAAEHWPLGRLERLQRAAGEGPRRLIAAVGEELESLFCAPRLRRAALLDERELLQARALSAVRRALDELGELARKAPELAPGPAQLGALLADLPLDAPARPPAGRVIFCDPLSLHGRPVRALFLCGLQEGVFPAPPPPQPLLGEEDRRSLARASGLVLPRTGDWLAAERHLLYRACSHAQERLTVSWHTAEEDGAPAAPSLFVDDLCDAFDERLRQSAARPKAATAAGPGLAEAPIAPLHDAAVLEQLRARQVWSASSLEAWSACPVRWLVERLLRVEGLEEDSEPLLRGALAHAVLRETLERLREQTGSARLTPASLERARRLLAESLHEQAARHLATLPPERATPLRRRLQADLERYLEHAAGSPSPLEPTHLELEFGFDGPGPSGRPGLDGEPGDALPALDLGDGVKVRGRIDRVDVGAGGEAVVYDYKGASAAPGARWADEPSLQVALYMQAAEQLLGGRAVGGFYQPLAARDLRARGLLDADADVELDCVRTDLLPREEVDDTLARCRAVALTAVAQARAGALQPRPRTCGYDGGCAYPEICRCER